MDSCEPVTVVLPGLRVRAAGELAGPLRDAVHALKYRAEHALAAELGGLVARLVARDLATGVVVDAVVPLAMHRSRLRQRGYDQALLLAEQVALSCGSPLLAALHRIRWTRPQVELDRAARLDNARGAFAGVAGSLGGLRIALVDDVVTTGATATAAASALRRAGASHVEVVAAARTSPPIPQGHHAP